MKTRSFLAFLTFPAAALLLLAASCSRPDQSAKSWSPPQPVSITGDGTWMVGYPLWHFWQSPQTDGDSSGLLLRDGDVLGSKIGILYRANDGSALKLSETDWCVRLAGKVVSISLKEGSEGREWLQKAPDWELSALRFLTLSDEVDAGLLAALKRLAAVNPGVALAVSPDTTLQQVLPLFRPQMLAVTDGSLDAATQRILADQPQIETLAIGGGASGALEILPKLRHLRRLVIADWDVKKSGPLPAGLDGLRSISVAGSSMRDLSALAAAPTDLQELSLWADNLADVGALSRWPELKTLLLSGDKKLPALPDLASLKQLRWAGLPPETTQEQFAAFIAAHRNLKILELIGCEKITDLAPLRKLKGLEGLVIMGSETKLDVLRELKTLRFVGLDHDLFKISPEQIAAVRKALPDALVVPVSGFCLGSGWILLLIPVVAGIRFLRRRWRAAIDARHA